MKQIYLYKYGAWVDVVNENYGWYAAVDVDGVNTIVLKDGTAMVRNVGVTK